MKTSFKKKNANEFTSIHRGKQFLVGRVHRKGLDLLWYWRAGVESGTGYKLKRDAVRHARSEIDRMVDGT